MNDTAIDILASLQAIDQRRRERTLEIEGLEETTAKLEAALEEQTAIVVGQREAAGLAAVRRRELEALLAEQEKRVMERRMRIGRIRNDKELEAAQNEINSLREAKARHEEELLDLMEQGETTDGELEAAEAGLQEQSEGARSHGEEASARTATLRAEIDAEAAERERVAAQLPQNLRRRYEQVFTRRAGLAVVRVRNGNCLGCKMKVPPQLYNEVLRRESIQTCPDCQRILYWREETEADLEQES